jgi:hypothetical protein
MSPVFSVKISLRQQGRVHAAPLPAALSAAGLQRFGVANAIRYAVISYLDQGEPLPSATLGSRSAGVWLQVTLPETLHLALEARCAAEKRSKASVIRAAIELAFPPSFLPPASEVCASVETPRRSLNACSKLGDVARQLWSDDPRTLADWPIPASGALSRW